MARKKSEELEDQLDDEIEDSEDDESADDLQDDDDGYGDGEEESDDSDDSDEDQGKAEGEDEEQSETEAEKRERRRQERQERKRKQKEAQQHRDRELQRLMAENRELRERQDRLEKTHTTEYAAKVDHYLNEAQEILKETQEEIAKAITNRDGARYRRLEQVRDEAKEKIAHFEGIKKQIETANLAPQQGFQQALIRNAQHFRSKFRDYNPHGKDEYSQTINRLDRELMAERKLNPAYADYWHELERRIEAATKAKPQPQKSKSSPTSGAGSRPEGKKTFTLSEERRRAIKELGVEEGSKEWQDWVSYYRRYDKERVA